MKRVAIIVFDSGETRAGVIERSWQRVRTVRHTRQALLYWTMTRG